MRKPPAAASVTTAAAPPAPRPLGPAQARVVAAAREALAEARRRMRSREEPPEERLHRMRVTIKRLRTYWRLAMPHLPPAAAEAEQQRLRAVAHSLAVFRDADVSAALALRMLRRARRPADRAAVRRWAARQRTLAGSPAVRGRALGAALRLLQPVPGRLAGPADPAGDWDWLEPGLRRAYDRARRRWRHCRAGGQDGDFHAWRRRIKDLQYFTELLRPMAPHPLGRRLKRLRRVADLLGNAHDLVLLREGLLAQAHPAPMNGRRPPALPMHRELLRRLERRIAAGYRQALLEARPMFARAPADWIAALRTAWQRRRPARHRPGSGT